MTVGERRKACIKQAMNDYVTGMLDQLKYGCSFDLQDAMDLHTILNMPWEIGEGQAEPIGEKEFEESRIGIGWIECALIDEDTGKQYADIHPAIWGNGFIYDGESAPYDPAEEGGYNEFPGGWRIWSDGKCPDYRTRQRWPWRGRG